MKAKKLTNDKLIFRCGVCDHSRLGSDVVGDAFFMMATTHHRCSLVDKRLDSLDEIPDFCPLEDFE